MQSAVLLFAHGARDPEWANPLRAVQQVLKQDLPDHRVELAFLEFMSPTLAESCALLAEQGIQRITVVPLFIAQGGHLKRELPEMVDQLRSTHPALDISLSGPVGETAEVIRAMASSARALAGL